MIEACLQEIEKNRTIVRQILNEIGKISTIDLAQLPDPSHVDENSRIEKIWEKAVQAFEPSVRKRIWDEFFGLGPLASLVDDETITEIIVNGLEHVALERVGKLTAHSDCFLSDVTYHNFLVRLQRQTKTQATMEHPFADGKWNLFRVHISAPPCSEDGVIVCLRRHPKVTWTLESLADKGWCDSRTLNVLEDLIQSRVNILVVGPTGSGKTSVLNAFLQKLRPTERVLIIEDTSELILPNFLSSKLIARYDYQRILKDVDQGELIRQALRMRPDRIVVGEVRGAEAKDLLMAMATGHCGSWGSLHADSARQALLRLEMLVQLGAPQWSLTAIRSLILLSIQAIVSVRKDSSGNRLINAIHRISSLEDFGFLLEQVT